MSDMKAFQINDHEVWAGQTLEEAIQAAMKATGLPRKEVAEEYLCGEVDPSMRVITETTTVGEILKGMTEPGFVCGEES